MIKCLVWDFDGVLCDSRSVAFKMHNKISYKYNLPKVTSKKDYSEILDNNALNKYLSPVEIEKYYYEHRKLMYDYRNNLKLFNDVVEFIKNTSIKSILITATYEKLVREVFIKEGYDPLIFEYILGRETVGGKKDKVQKVYELLNVNEGEILYIGDTLNDVNFCSNLNIPILVSGYGYSEVGVANSKGVLEICDSELDLINYLKILLSNDSAF